MAYKVKIQKFLNLHVVLYGRKICSLKFLEEQNVRVFHYKVLMKIFDLRGRK